MVQTTKPAEPKASPYVVLRPICMDGDRVEVGATVELTRLQGTELETAGKVAPAGSPAADAAVKAASEPPADPAGEKPAAD